RHLAVQLLVPQPARAVDVDARQPPSKGKAAGQEQNRDRQGLRRAEPEPEQAEKAGNDHLVAEQLPRRGPVHTRCDELLPNLVLAVAAEASCSRIAETSGKGVERTPSGCLTGSASGLGDVAVRSDLVEHSRPAC